MFKKLSLILGIAMTLSLMPITGSSQTGGGTTDTKTEEHHTGVKRTYNKAKHKVRHAWHKTKSATSNAYNKAKTRVTTDDSKQDAGERK
jgi:hypothetical protein